MSFDFLILIFCFIVFLFSLYIFTNDDFILLRKNVPMDKVFDLAFLAGIIAVFFARISYVVFNFKPLFLNPLAFAVFPYFPGLSLAGAVLGVFLYLLLISKISILPVFHLSDFISLSFLSSLPFWFLIKSLLSLSAKKPYLLDIINFSAFSVLFILIYALFKKTRLKEGSIGFISLISFSVFSFLLTLVRNFNKFNFFENKDNFLLLAAFLLGIITLIKQENLSDKFRRHNGN